MTRNAKLISGALVVLLLAGWFVGVWRPGTHRLAAAHHQLAAAQTKQTQLQGELLRLEALAKQVKQVQRQFEIADRAAPGTPSIPSAIDQIAAAAKKAGVRWTNETQALAAASASTAPGAPTTPAGTSGSTDGLSTLAMTLSISGSYKQVLDFVTALEHMPRVFVVDTLSLSGPGGGLTVSVSGRAFFDDVPTPAMPKIG